MVDFCGLLRSAPLAYVMIALQNRLANERPLRRHQILIVLRPPFTLRNMIHRILSLFPFAIKLLPDASGQFLVPERDHDLLINLRLGNSLLGALSANEALNMVMRNPIAENLASQFSSGMCAVVRMKYGLADRLIWKALWANLHSFSIVLVSDQ
jgi:hypothetical protein